MEYINVDWRHGPSHRELCGRLEKHLVEIDSAKGTSTIFIPSAGPNAVQRDNGGHNVAPMMRQKKIFKFRPLPVKKPPVTVRAEKYAGWYFYILSKTMEKCWARVSTNKRATIYEFSQNSRGLTSEKVEALLHDLALSIDVHPYCLGVRTEWKSQVYIPEGCQLEMHEVGDIFSFLDGHRAMPTTYRHGTHPIPGMIHKLTVQAVGQSIRAIIVTEHRNVKTYLEYMHGAAAMDGLEGTMLVMLGGYADFAAREFLCLLSKQSSLKNVPFLWISDCDVDGLSIFAQCKYGTRTSAYASEIMVCPPLEYVGMNKGTLDQAVAKHAERQVTHEKRRNSSLSTEEEATLLQMHNRIAGEKHAVLSMNTMNDAQRARADNMLKSLKAVLIAERDQLALSSLEDLLLGQAPLALSCVNQLDPHGTLYVMRDVVLAARNEGAIDVPVWLQHDSLREAWAERGSQNVPVAHAMEEDDEMIAEEEIAMIE